VYVVFFVDQYDTGAPPFAEATLLLCPAYRLKLLLLQPSGTYVVAVDAASSTNLVLATNPIVPNRVHVLAFSVDGAQQRCFASLDGRGARAQTQGPPSAALGDWRIGAGFVGGMFELSVRHPRDGAEAMAARASVLRAKWSTAGDVKFAHTARYFMLRRSVAPAGPMGLVDVMVYSGDTRLRPTAGVQWPLATTLNNGTGWESLGGGLYWEGGAQLGDYLLLDLGAMHRITAVFVSFTNGTTDGDFQDRNCGTDIALVPEGPGDGRLAPRDAFVFEVRSPMADRWFTFDLMDLP
jgi:hypothetical protein